MLLKYVCCSKVNSSAWNLISDIWFRQRGKVLPNFLKQSDYFTGFLSAFLCVYMQVKLSAKRELSNIFANISVCTCHSFKTAKTQQSLNSWVEAVKRDQRGSMTQGSFDCYQIVCSVCICRTCFPSLLKTY